MSSCAAARTAPSGSTPVSGGYRSTRRSDRVEPSIIEASGIEKRSLISLGVFSSTQPSSVVAIDMAISRYCSAASLTSDG